MTAALPMGATAPRAAAPAVRPSPARLARRLRGFARASSGATAVEFGLLALPFLALVGATVEAGVTYWAQEMLQQAVADAGRQIYTGRFQTTNAAVKGSTNLLDAFRTELCMENGHARFTLFTCANVKISIVQADKFADATLVKPTQVDPTTKVSDWNPSFSGYACGGSKAVMIVQAAVDFPVVFTLMNAGVATLPNRRRVLQAASVFQVEPYDSTPVCS